MLRCLQVRKAKQLNSVIRAGNQQPSTSRFHFTMTTAVPSLFVKGVAYTILPRSCVFNVTALRETGWSDKLSELLEETLLEMQRLVEMDWPPDSKL
jgi:hypothetical protein